MSRSFRKNIRAKELRKRKFLKEHEQQKLENIKESPIHKKVEKNLHEVKRILGEESKDVTIRRFHLAGKKPLMCAIVFIDGLADKTIINDFILKSLMFDARGSDLGPGVSKNDLYRLIEQYDLTINEIGEISNMRKVIRSILNGDTVFFIEGSERAFATNTKGWEHRGVEEPGAEAVVRGPREGFTETLRVNTALVRRRLKDPDLRCKQFAVGERTNTGIALMYIEGVADENLVKKIETRIKKIEIDGALESGYIEQLIEDNHWSPFPQIQYTQRPDKVTGNILEGKVAIIVDGTPFALIAPAVFSQFWQSPEDYYERFWISSFVRFIRLISMFIALLAPSLYIAFSSFHPEMIPSELLIAMAAGRSTVPFPSVVEALILEITIEILREASVRLPGPIGPTIGIVGALVIGESAVRAGLVSPLMVIVVSITTIGSFASPSYNAAISVRLLRFPLMFMAATFGLYGIMLFLLIIVLHMSSLKSFGVPYIAPLSPAHLSDLKDVLFRAPLEWMQKRPVTMKPKDDKRKETKKPEKGGATVGESEQPDQEGGDGEGSDESKTR